MSELPDFGEWRRGDGRLHPTRLPDLDDHENTLRLAAAVFELRHLIGRHDACHPDDCRQKRGAS